MAKYGVRPGYAEYSDNCMDVAIDIAKSYAGSVNANPGIIPGLIESVYNKLMDLAQKVKPES
jgi:hypothetical protein